MIRVFALGACFLLAACGTPEAVKCTAANCSGCCTEAGECVGSTKQSAQVCGTPGSTCRVCLPGQLCSAGNCLRNPDAGVILDDAGVVIEDAGAGDSGAACGARFQPCCAGNGCFLGYSCERGVCDVAAVDAGPCGGQGQPCCAGQSCTGSGLSCNGTTCVTSGADAGPLLGTGEPCALDRECLDGACLAFGFTGGYCTRACASSTDCLAGSQCGVNPSGVGPARVCLKQCSQPGSAPGGCRGGYVCEANAGTSSVPVCFPACTSNTQCGLAPTCDSRGFCCGVAGFVCCGGTMCEPGNTCSSGTCQTAAACGNAGQACCTTGTACLGSTVCQSNTCRACGGLSQPCCASNTCNQGSCTSGTCQSTASCGNVGQACCATGTACLGQAVCQAGTNTCAACGGAGQPCCASNMCSVGTCTSGTCQTSTRGGVGAACTNYVNDCTGNTCLQPSGNLWSGGYCSENCTSSACPTGSSCSPYLGGAEKYCLKHCAWDGGAGDCRAGYVCDRYLIEGTNQATCYPACTTGADCGAGGTCGNGFCCGKRYFRCCPSGQACQAGTTCTNGYCL